MVLPAHSPTPPYLPPNLRSIVLAGLLAGGILRADPQVRTEALLGAGCLWLLRCRLGPWVGVG